MNKIFLISTARFCFNDFPRKKNCKTLQKKNYFRFWNCKSKENLLHFKKSINVIELELVQQQQECSKINIHSQFSDKISYVL